MSEENFYSVVREELFRKLRELIDRLPEERKKIMLMSLEGKSGEEIACDLNITIHTVKQQKYRAYKFLREQLGQYTFPIKNTGKFKGTKGRDFIAGGFCFRGG